MSIIKYSEFQSILDQCEEDINSQSPYKLSFFNRRGCFRPTWEQLITIIKYQSQQISRAQCHLNLIYLPDTPVKVCIDIDRVSTFTGDLKDLESKILKHIVDTIKKTINAEKVSTEVIHNLSSGNCRVYTNLIILGKYRAKLHELLQETASPTLRKAIKFDGNSMMRSLFSYKRRDQTPEEKEEWTWDKDREYKVSDTAKGCYSKQPGKYADLMLDYSGFVPEGTEIAQISEDYLEEWNIVPEKQEVSREEILEKINNFTSLSPEALETVLVSLDPDTDGKTWRGIVQALYNYGATNEAIHQWSARSNQYDDSAKAEIDRLEDPANRFPYGFRILAANGAQEISQPSDKSIVQFEDGEYWKGMDSDLDSALFAFDLLGDTVKITWDTGDWCYGYIWNTNTYLWEPKKKEVIQARIMERLLTKATIHYNELIEPDAIKCMEKAIKKLKSAGGQRCIFSLCVAKFIDTEFKSQLDRVDLDTIPLKGGMLYNMRSRESRIRTISDHFSKELECRIADSTDRAQAYMRELFHENWERANKIFGYTWTPLNDLKKAIVAIGGKNTGKSTLFRMTTANMGDRFKPMSERAIFEGRNQSVHNDELGAALTRTTLTICSETKDGMVMNEKIIKDIVGNDSLSIRRCAGRTESLKSIAKLIICCNNQPLTSGDPTFLPKLLYLNFPFEFEDTMENKMKMEALAQDRDFLDQLFTLQMRGAYEYYETRRIDDDIKTRNEYLGSDPVSTWLSIECIQGEEKTKIPQTHALEQFRRWAAANTTAIKVSDLDFSKGMKTLFKVSPRKIDGKSVKCYIGVRYKTEEEIQKEVDQLEE